MSENCCGVNEAGRNECEPPVDGFERIEKEPGDCPECGTQGKPIDSITVKALINKTLRLVSGDDYRFCKDPGCSVVYFANMSDQIFSTEDIRVAVYQKQPRTPDVEICYCFNHSVSEISRASADRREEIVADINEGIKAGQCACDIRNPQGSCCLGNVRTFVKALEKEMEKPA